MLDYIEKTTAAADHESPLASSSKMSPFIRLLPYKMLLKKATAQIETMRRSMGGIQRDITTRPIVMQDFIIDGDSDKIRVRSYKPAESAADRDGILFIHGGGWIGGTIGAVEEFCKALADHADAVVLSVEYHLAPEHKFPVGLTDCWKALLWFHANAASLGVDSSKLTVGGDSAGGNYSAVLSQMARSSTQVSLKAQLLIYPAVLLTTAGVASPDASGKSNPLLRMVIDWYLSDANLANDWRVSPALAESLANLPPALIAVCEHDGLTPSAKSYAEKLAAVGVKTRCILYKDTYHAFIDNTGYAPQADDLLDEIAAFLR